MIYKVYFYYYYLLYTRIIPDATPYSTSIFVFGMLISYVASGTIDIISILLYCKGIGVYSMLGITILSLILSYLLYKKYGGKKIISEKPLFFNSHGLSLAIVSISSLAIISWLFWGAIYAHKLLETCK